MSSDGSTFTNVFTGKSSGTILSLETYVLPGGTTGRYVRITINDNNMNRVAGITELSIDGSSNFAPPQPTANNENIQTNSGTPVQITLTGTESNRRRRTEVHRGNPSTAWSFNSGTILTV